MNKPGTNHLTVPKKLGKVKPGKINRFEAPVSPSGSENKINPELASQPENPDTSSSKTSLHSDPPEVQPVQIKDHAVDSLSIIEKITRLISFAKN